MTDPRPTVPDVDFVIEQRPYEDPDVVRLVAEVQAVYVAMYGGPDAAVVEPGEFLLPQGLFLVGLLDGTPVATGGWRRTGGADAEIKRMYVSPPARRRGLARLILAELERTAAGAGIRRLILNTGPHQSEAIALYGRSGYRPTVAFGYYAEHGEALFFAKPVASAHDLPQT